MRLFCFFSMLVASDIKSEPCAQIVCDYCLKAQDLWLERPKLFYAASFGFAHSIRAALSKIFDLPTTLCGINPCRQSEVELLQAGHHITFEQVEAVEKSHYGTQALPDETYEVSDIEIEIKGSDVDYATSGHVFELFYAEKYHHFRWNFPYGRYVFLGIPDGITNDFVYEFKSGAKARFRPERTKEAVVQGDLYGYFFKKRMKRVGVYTDDDRRIASHNSPVDEGNAIIYLRNFARVDGLMRSGLRFGLPARNQIDAANQELETSDVLPY
jgi:hypothetical protein